VETCTCMGIKRKEKKEGRGREQESRLSPPRSCPPQKPRIRAAAVGGARSVVGPDGRITEFGSL